MPEVRYAKSGDLHIAYQVLGQGDLDLVLIPEWATNIESFWQEPGIRRMLRRLSSFVEALGRKRRPARASGRARLSPEGHVTVQELLPAQAGRGPVDRDYRRP